MSGGSRAFGSVNHLQAMPSTPKLTSLALLSTCGLLLGWRLVFGPLLAFCPSPSTSASTTTATSLALSHTHTQQENSMVTNMFLYPRKKGHVCGVTFAALPRPLRAGLFFSLGPFPPFAAAAAGGEALPLPFPFPFALVF